jgi:hypothetical protein
MPSTTARQRLPKKCQKRLSKKKPLLHGIKLDLVPVSAKRFQLENPHSMV